MSTSNSSDWFSSSVKKSSNSSDHVKSLMGVISEIVKLSIMTENDSFITMGRYFYRVSSIIVELENTPTNAAADILQPLSHLIYTAKTLFSKHNTNAPNILKHIIRQMGQVLNTLHTASTEDNLHYAIQSLVKDMNDFCFEKCYPYNENDLYSIHNDFGSSTDDENVNVMNFSYMEPLYEAFLCPLTKEIMNDPVTIETGVTYERFAIVEWYNKFSNPADIICPKTGVKLTSRGFNRNIALMETIKQWEERNEEATIKAAKSTLSLEINNKTVILEALCNLKILCKKKEYNVVAIRIIGVIPLLGEILKRQDRDLTFESLELLRQLTEYDDEDDGKEMIARTVGLSEIIQILSSEDECIRHSALLLLVELSKSSFFCDEIGSVSEGVLVLVTLRYRQRVDPFALNKVDEILKNLEKSSRNIKIMAENGHWQPILHHFLQGDEETKMEMASNIAEIFLGLDDEIKHYVAETATPALLGMVTHGNSLARNVSFKALNKISSHRENGKILVKSGIIGTMLNETFKRTIYNEPMNSKAEATSILANILESGSVELDDLQVDQKMSLDYIVYNIIKRVGNFTTDEFNLNFVRILLCLMEFPKTEGIVVSMVKESDACTSVIELLNNPNEVLQVVTIMFCTVLSPFIGHKLADILCRIRGQPQTLLQELPETTAPTEKQAVSAIFLAKLPHENISLNLALLETVPFILRKINQVQKFGSRMSKYGSVYLEGLVGILVRFTVTLHQNEFLILAKKFSFCNVFTELLTNTVSDEVQRLSATGLQNLSSKTVTLSKPAEIKKLKYKCFWFYSRNLQKVRVCPVHKGLCSAQETFCLLEANTVENLLACFDHKNVQLVEAAVSAICTLLDERVDLETSVSILIQAKAIQHVLNVIKDHKKESLWQKSFWILDKLLTEGDRDSASQISQHRFLRATLINVLHYGNADISLMAQKILTFFNSMPSFNNNFTI